MKHTEKQYQEALSIINELLGWANEVVSEPGESKTVNACQYRYDKLTK